MGISIREYAKHRGIHHSSVQEAIKSGRITTLSDGTIDTKTADKQWTENTRAQPSGIKAFQEIKLKNEAVLLHYKVQQASGKYVALDEVRSLVSIVFSDLRDHFINRCHRLAPRLVNQSDILKIARLLEEDTKQMITEYRNDFQNRILALSSADTTEAEDT